MIFIEKEDKRGSYVDVEHRILYIEYIDGIPHNVMTAEYIPNATHGAYWCMHHWDFFANGGCKEDIRYYNSGSGGCAYENGIPAPHFIVGCSAEIWKDKDVPFIGEPKNVAILDEPKGNPFELASEESLGYEYCERCDETIDTTYDWACQEHMCIDDDNELRYIDNNELVNK